MLQGYYKVVWFDKQGFESNKAFAIAMESDMLQVFPNPAGDKVRVVLHDMQAHDTRLSLYNTYGRQVLKLRLSKGTNPEIDLSMLTSGLYYIRAEINNKVYRERLLKE